MSGNGGITLLVPISQGRAIDPELFCDFAQRSIWARRVQRDGVTLELFRVNLTGQGGRLLSFPTPVAGIRVST